MRSFHCPKCEEKTSGLMYSAGHFCPAARNKWVTFIEDKEEDK